MSTTTTQDKQQEIRNAFIAAQQRLLPAKLKETLEARTHTEQSITQYMLAHQLAPTAENFYSAFKALVKSLPWAVKPASLVRDEQAMKPDKIQPAQKAEGEFVAKVRQGEKDDAYQKEQDAFEKSALELVAMFLPMTRSQRIDHRKQAEVQTLLKTHIENEKKRNVRMKDVHAVVAEHIRKEYEKIEKQNERL